MRLEPQRRTASFRVVDIIGRGLSLSFSNFFSFALLAVVLATPLFLIEWMAVESGTRGLLIDLWWNPSSISEIEPTLVIVYLIGYIILTNILAAAVTFGTLQTLRQRDARVGESLSQGISRLLPVMGIYLWAMFVAWLVPFLLTIAAEALAEARGSAGGELLAVILWVGALVIFFIFLVRYFVALPAVVVEGKGVLSALSRSVEMTKGRRGKIFLVSIIYLVLYIILLFITEAVIGSTERGIYYGSLENAAAALAMIYAVEMLAHVLASVIACVAYWELIRAEEGVDGRRIAAVFD